jgi:hypothetical protein
MPYVIAMICAGCFTVQWTWTFNTDPEGLYLGSSPRGRKYELFCGMNINNPLIISILLGMSGSVAWKQRNTSRGRCVGVPHLSIFKYFYI